MNKQNLDRLVLKLYNSFVENNLTHSEAVEVSLELYLETLWHALGGELGSCDIEGEAIQRGLERLIQECESVS